MAYRELNPERSNEEGIKHFKGIHIVHAAPKFKIALGLDKDREERVSVYARNRKEAFLLAEKLA